MENELFGRLVTHLRFSPAASRSVAAFLVWIDGETGYGFLNYLWQKTDEILKFYANEILAFLDFLNNPNATAAEAHQNFPLLANLFGHLDFEFFRENRTIVTLLESVIDDVPPQSPLQSAEFGDGGSSHQMRLIRSGLLSARAPEFHPRQSSVGSYSQFVTGGPSSSSGRYQAPPGFQRPFFVDQGSSSVQPPLLPRFDLGRGRGFQRPFLFDEGSSSVQSQLRPWFDQGRGRGFQRPFFVDEASSSVQSQLGPWFDPGQGRGFQRPFFVDEASSSVQSQLRPWFDPGQGRGFQRPFFVDGASSSVQSQWRSQFAPGRGRGFQSQASSSVQSPLSPQVGFESQMRPRTPQESVQVQEFRKSVHQSSNMSLSSGSGLLLLREQGQSGDVVGEEEPSWVQSLNLPDSIYPPASEIAGELNFTEEDVAQGLYEPPVALLFQTRSEPELAQERDDKAANVAALADLLPVRNEHGLAQEHDDQDANVPPLADEAPVRNQPKIALQQDDQAGNVPPLADEPPVGNEAEIAQQQDDQMVNLDPDIWPTITEAIQAGPAPRPALPPVQNESESSQEQRGKEINHLAYLIDNAIRSRKRKK